MRGVAEQRNQGSDDDRSGGSPGVAPRSVRAMVFAMLPLVLVVLGIAGLTGRCSVNPLGSSLDTGTAPTVNASQEFESAAAGVDFPVLHPHPPDGWRANSADTEQITQQDSAVRVGWLTEDTHYVRLSQSSAPEAELVSSETEQPPRARGTVRAAGEQWVVYESVRSEVAWVGERSGVRLLITGNGTEEEFRMMARAAIDAPVVHSG
ncbi:MULTISPECIES: DUF4245 domain-containing protein [unclassified Actinopolyspora]|uniref:DUF4245 domain-containing protein n=1 Tax=unclassified Actinopolyspora TaxID=2639451 RepID=UPI0013F5CE3E|nr:MULTISPECIES: DUF4245 domain-containing protein [unclassified Actinopolyspora]NHD17871.1 DUF4245 domain-containing protein [Actinopolyspora sp. BKK2]NHE77744.1 DUF4245 domain-containing protein [Actinopolyspora sp. BKK1]